MGGGCAPLRPSTALFRHLFPWFPASVECTGLLSCLNRLPTTYFHDIIYLSHGVLTTAITLLLM